ncbi:predicted protein, partial [Streptomyces albidoflavus]
MATVVPPVRAPGPLGSASVRSGRISLTAPTRVVLPAPKPPATTTFRVIGGSPARVAVGCTAFIGALVSGRWIGGLPWLRDVSRAGGGRRGRVSKAVANCRGLSDRDHRGTADGHAGGAAAGDHGRMSHDHTHVREFFTPRAATWDSRFPDDGPAYEAAVRALGPRPGDAVLDAGCGTGRALPALRAAVGPAGTVLGADLT